MANRESRPSQVGGIPAEQLRSIIERVERLELEKKAIADDIVMIYAEAKGNGFDIKTIRKIVRLRKLSAEERAEEEALLDIYMAALGMLADTPLGQAAITRMTARRTPAPREEPSEETEDKPAPEAKPATTLEEARAMGKQAAESGKSVLSNPFGPTDACRAAFDEGWCQASGSDGMDLPEAWKRTKKNHGDEK